MQTLSEYYNYIMGNIYLRFMFILVITLVAAFLIKLIVKQVLRPLTKKTKTKIDDILVNTLSTVIFYVVFALGFKIGFQHFEFKSSIYNSIIDTALVIIVCVLIIRIIKNFAEYWQRDWAAKTASTADDRLIPLAEKIMKVVVIVLGIIFIFDSWSIDISPLLATAGIAGLAVSFAVKDSLANMLGGLQLVLDKTFKVGDKIKIESGEMGVVKDIGLRSTKLKTYDNEVIYIPNGYMANAKIKNYTVPDLTLRVNVEFGVEYGSDPEEVRKVVLAAIKGIETVLEAPAPVVSFIKMSDFSLDFVARTWVENYGDAYSTKLLMIDVIYYSLNKAGIGIPFPTQTIYTKSEDGDKNVR